MTRTKKRTRARATSTDFANQHGKDPATVYAEAVLKRDIVAGPWVRKACERHVSDLSNAKKLGIKWRLDLCERAFGYFRHVLRLNGGQFEKMPFELRLWQAFIVGSIYGWIGTDGFRRFRTAYIEIGKGNGKSPLAAGCGMYCLTADGEARAEVYAAAATKDQAMVAFRDAIAMKDQSPQLQKKLIAYGGLNPWNMFYPKTDSFFRVISADDKQSGPRPHCSICDELHEHPDGTVVDMLHFGFKFRRQPLMLEITNSGVDRQSICYQHHEYSQRVLDGRVFDLSWFAYVCSLSKGDKWQDEKVWPKANPNLGVSVTLKYLREQVKLATGMPALQSKIRRLNFCEWVGAATPWIDGDKWFACETESLDLAQYRGTRCWAGLDLSARNDLTAAALVFARPDKPGHYDAFLFFWTPEEGLLQREERDKAPYTLWRDQGHLEATPGASVNYEYVGRRLKGFYEDYGLAACAFDRWRIDDLEREFEDANFEYTRLKMDSDDKELAKARGLFLVEHGQGFKDMTPAVEAITTAVVNGTLRVKINPVLTMCSGNAVVKSGPAEEKKFDKREAKGRIDGIVALAMGLRAAAVFKGREGGTIYDTEGLLVV